MSFTPFQTKHLPREVLGFPGEMSDLNGGREKFPLEAQGNLDLGLGTSPPTEMENFPGEENLSVCVWGRGKVDKY